MRDVQNEIDESGVDIELAGITGLRLPMIVKDREDETQTVIVDFEIATDLWKHRGVHMSRFVELLEEQYGKVLSLNGIHELLSDIVKIQEAKVAYIRAGFDYFVPIIAPTSGIKSKLPIKIIFEASPLSKPILTVTTPVMLVCPCSLEISDKGQAHNQRGYIKMSIQSNDWVWIEELVHYSYMAGSYPVFPLLKREDEKTITDESHKRPRFVEDAVREAVKRLEQDKRITWWRVRVDSKESIHAHDAFAETTGGDLD